MKDEAGEEGGGGGIKTLIKRGGASWNFSGPGGGKGRCKKNYLAITFSSPPLPQKMNDPLSIFPFWYIKVSS